MAKKCVREWLAPDNYTTTAWIGWDTHLKDIEIADCHRKVVLGFRGQKGQDKFFRLYDVIVSFGVACGWLEDDDG